ncbi:MAG: hypothetical protein MI922_14975 [Bacteroidales bacterium]|nr:hypothetical protein [Bacteroidales bacterium]
MKTILKILIAIFVLSNSVIGMVNAQEVKIKNKEYKKSVKKKSKEFKKKGYTPKGSGTVELYVTTAMNKEFERNENGEQTTFVVYTSKVDPTFDGAVTACRASARATIAGNIETRVAELVKRNLNSDQISMKHANGINQTIIAGKQLIAQNVSIEDIYVMYREVKDEMDGKTLIEVEYACAYNHKLALQKAQEYIRKELKQETEELHKDLDKLFKLKE